MVSIFFDRVAYFCFSCAIVSLMASASFTYSSHLSYTNIYYGELGIRINASSMQLTE